MEDKTDVKEEQGADFSWTWSQNVSDEKRTHATEGFLVWEVGDSIN